MDVALSTSVVTAAVLGPVLLSRWHATPDTPSLRRLSSVQDSWVRRADTKVGAVTVVDAAAIGQMSSEAREQSARMQRAAQGHVIAIATVLADGGFRASLVRSVLTGIAFLSSLRAEQKVFSAAAPASAWLTAALRAERTTVDQDALLGAIEELMRREPAPPSLG